MQELSKNVKKLKYVETVTNKGMWLGHVFPTLVWVMEKVEPRPPLHGVHITPKNPCISPELVYERPRRIALARPHDTRGRQKGKRFI